MVQQLEEGHTAQKKEEIMTASITYSFQPFHTDSDRMGWQLMKLKKLKLY